MVTSQMHVIVNSARVDGVKVCFNLNPSGISLGCQAQDESITTIEVTYGILNAFIKYFSSREEQQLVSGNYTILITTYNVDCVRLNILDKFAVTVKLPVMKTAVKRMIELADDFIA